MPCGCYTPNNCLAETMQVCIASVEELETDLLGEDHQGYPASAQIES